MYHKITMITCLFFLVDKDVKEKLEQEFKKLSGKFMTTNRKQSEVFYHHYCKYCSNIFLNTKDIETHHSLQYRYVWHYIFFFCSQGHLQKFLLAITIHIVMT